MRNVPARRGLAAVGLAAVVLTGAACDRQESAARTAGGPSGTPQAAAPRQVRVVAALEERLPVTVAVTGTLAADQEILVGFKVAGRVAELTVDLGSRVRRGQLIARLDSTDFRHRVAQAEAALRQARARLGLAPDGADDRVNPEQTAIVREARAVLDEARLTRDRSERLWKDELIARAQLDTAVAALRVAEGRYQAAVEEVRNRQALLAERRSELALARQQLADTEIHAPIDGAVRERRASVGEFLAAGAPIASLVRVHPLRLRVAVPERQAPGIRVGQRVLVQIEGDPAEHTGRVVRTSPVIVEQTRTLTIEAEVANPDGRLRPGAFAKAEIVVEAAQPAVLVPTASIVTFAGIERVIAVENGRSVEKQVRTGRRAGDRVEILEGLEPGESVVVEPGNLTGGQPVAVAK
ncbi:MAG: efflux RND transporter periplasmic adaptor subunit [Candidatus Rokuibacteriota bacterium]